MELIFGIGALWGTRNDVANVGPDQFGVLNDNSIDFSFELKELYSQYQFPIDIARGKGKIAGKAKMARIFGSLYADLFFGLSTTPGEDNVAENELHTVATTTVTVSNATSFVSDLGVYYNASGNVRFTTVTGTPTAIGQYSTGTNGVYTFFSSDISKSVAISYAYTDSSGKTITITNQFMGYTPTFASTFYNEKNTQGTTGQITLLLNYCVASKLTFPTKIDDYGIPDFDYMAFANAIGNIGSISVTE